MSVWYLANNNIHLDHYNSILSKPLVVKHFLIKYKDGHALGINKVKNIIFVMI